jgi:hypothetical protein
MIAAFVYRKDTGVIVQRMWADSVEAILAALSPELDAAQTVPGAEENTHYVSGNQLLPYPPRPSPNVEWDGSAWVDKRTLQQQKDAKWREVETACKEAIITDFIKTHPKYAAANGIKARIDAAANRAQLDAIENTV